MKMFDKVSAKCKKFDEKYMAMTLGLTMALMNLGVNSASAKTITGLSGEATMSVEWPWTKFINALATQLTGPLPKILGVMGIVGAAVALFAGNGGPGTQKFIMLIFAISIALFAPSFLNYLNESASNSAMIDDVYGVVDAVKDVIQ